MEKLSEVDSLNEENQGSIQSPHKIISTEDHPRSPVSRDVSPIENSSQSKIALIEMPSQLMDSKNEIPLLELSPQKVDSTRKQSIQRLQKLLQDRQEYDVPLPLTTHVRSVYTETLGNYRSQPCSSITNDDKSRNSLLRIEKLLDDLQRLCDYLDPIQNDVTSYRHDFDMYEAKYAENISTKCMFIAEFLNLMKGYDKHIIILVRPDGVTEVLETILTAHEFVFSRANQPKSVEKNSAESKMRVTLLLTGREVYDVKPADIIIAFDSSYSRILDLDKLRKKGPDSKIPSGIILYLVITYSVEHLARILELTNDQGIEKTRVVELLYVMMGKVGTLPRGYPGPPDAAEAIARYLVCERGQDAWPLLPLPDIDEKIEHTQKERMQGLSGFTGEISGVPDETILVPRSAKRVSLTARSGSPKRHKAINSSDEYRHGYEHKHVLKVDPSRETSNINLRNNLLEILYTPTIEKPNIEENYAEFDETSLQNAVAESKNYVSLLQKKVSTLESQLRLKETRESELHHANQELELHCRDLEHSFKVIQPRFQGALNDRGLFEYEKNLAINRETKLRETLESKEVALLKIQQEKAEVDEKLKTIRQALSNSGIPELVEFEKNCVDMSTLLAENEILRKQNQITQSDFDYMQTNYQNASTSAASATKQVLGLNSEIERLKVKASENAVRIHQMQIDSTIGEFQATIRGLRAEKAELERQLEKLSGQYDALTNGRPKTRSNSVPHSPRMGASGPSPRPIGRLMGSFCGNG